MNMNKLTIVIVVLAMQLIPSIASASLILDYETGNFFDGDVYNSELFPTSACIEIENGRIDEMFFRYAAIVDSPWYEGCVRWMIPGGFVSCQWEGKPEVPISGYSIELPEGYRSVKITVLEAEYKDFSYQLMPALPEVSESEPQRFVDIVPYDGFFPLTQIVDNGYGIYRGLYIQYIGLWPVSYDYNNHIVRAYTHLKYKIEYSTEEAGTEYILNDVQIEEPHYYNLQGQIIANPQRGNIYILQKGNDVKKIVY